jgi:hypothetical protein
MDLRGKRMLVIGGSGLKGCQDSRPPRPGNSGNQRNSKLYNVGLGPIPRLFREGEFDKIIGKGIRR